MSVIYCRTNAVSGTLFVVPTVLAYAPWSREGVPRGTARSLVNPDLIREPMGQIVAETAGDIGCLMGESSPMEVDN